MVDDDSGLFAVLPLRIAKFADIVYRYTSTIFLTICKRRSRVCSARYLVFLDASRSTVSVPRTKANLQPYHRRVRRRERRHAAQEELFSLGEDRFLTTLLLKHFSTFKTKFIPDAVAHTMAPESWRVMFSQRRRWINSTIHNLCELVILPELCGFCCFSIRFFVFIDLFGTIVSVAS
jgi:hypothetical protein